MAMSICPADDLNAFSSDTGYDKYALENAVNFSNGELHVHGECGTVDCTHTTHENVLWTAIRTEAELRAIKGGTATQYYYLTNDIKLNGTSWNPTGRIALCLNGYSIIANGNFDTIIVNDGTNSAASLTLCDCNGSGNNKGEITHADGTTGRGVYVTTSGWFYQYGGNITGNSTSDNGGGVYLDGSFFYMYGGRITDNSANNGGGVAGCVKDKVDGRRVIGSLLMLGGTIADNKATANGGGVAMDCSFEMRGGSITNNEAGANGGGVAVIAAYTAQWSGGSVTGNTAQNSGGGVYVDSGVKAMAVGGDVNITRNINGNVYLPGGKKITVGGALNDSASIGVTSEAVPDDSTPVTIATAADNWINDNNFTADNSFYKVTVLDGKTATLGLHEHQWKVRVKTGSENILEEYCDVAGCTVADGTLTLEAPNQTYSGAPYHAASCTKSGDWKHTPNVGEFFYTDSTGTKIDAPVKAGTYYANVTVDGVTAKKEFFINLRRLDFGDFTFTPPSNLTYDGQPKTATVTLDEDKADAAGTITVKYIDKDNKVIVDENGAPVTSVTEAGTYTVGIDVTKGTGYDSMAMNRPEWTFTIGPKPVTITGISADDKTYDGTNRAVIKGMPAISGLVAGDEGAVTVEAASAKATFADVDAGTAKTVNFSGYALAGAKAGNYTLAQPASVTANISPKALTIADVTVADKAYDGTKTAAVTGVTFNGLVSSESLTKGTDYTVTGNFADAAVGDNKEVTVTVNLKDSVKNYTLSDTGYTKNGCKIVKAAVADPAVRDLTIINGNTTIYTVMLPQLLPSLVSPGEYGSLTYEEPQRNITDSSYHVTAEVRSGIEDGKLALKFTRTGSAEGSIGTIKVTVHSANYEDITLTINILATAKIVPQPEGTLKLTPSEITYGEKLSNITISGTMTANISPKALTIADVTVADKAYDGTKTAAVTGVTFNGLVSSESLTKGTDYTVTGNFADAAVGDNKEVTVTVNLKDSVKNYTLSDTGYTKNGCKIVKAAVADPAVRDLTIINGNTTIYTVMLPQLLPSLVSPGEYGSLTYEEPQRNITDSSYHVTAEVRSGIEDGKLALKFTRTGSAEGSIGTIKVTVHSANYEDITLTINILATAKIVPQPEGTLKLTPSEITYGEKLSNITISGTMTANGKEITGTFAWQNPDAVLNAGNQQAAWEFTPEDTQTYAETTGTTTVKVNKAEQSGAVRMDNYTYNETPATPALTEQKGDNNAAVTYYYSTTRTNSGGTEWKDIGSTTLKAGTYYMYAVIGETGNYKAYTTEAKAFEVWKAAPTYTKPSGLTAKYGQKLSEITLPNPAVNMSGTWRWEAPDTVIDKTGTVSCDAYFTPDDTNYKKVVGAAIEITVARGDGRNLATEELTLAFNDSADHTYTPDWSGLPAGQTWNYECGSSISNGSNATLTKLNVSAADGELTYAVSDGKAGDEITVILKARCNNYEDFTITLNIQITKALPTGAPKYTLITTEGKILADAGLTLTDSTLKPAAGKLEWMDAAGNVLTDDTEVKVNTIYWWRFTPTDTNYNSLTGEIELYHVDAPAISAQPKSVSMTVGEKATFEVTATGTDVTYQWKIDRNDGNGFVDITGATGAAYTTGVTDKDCDGFKYQCVIRNAAGSVTTDTVVLTVLYQIIEGANGSWNQSTDGESLRIRGNGEYSRFQNVKVERTINM